MIAPIEQNREALADLCRRYRVRTLEVFGSAADGTFNHESSDLDFLVEFQTFRRGEHFDAYFGLSESLEALFRRRVDLVEIPCLRNPYFISGVNQSRNLLYEARPEEIHS